MKRRMLTLRFAHRALAVRRIPALVSAATLAVAASLVEADAAGEPPNPSKFSDDEILGPPSAALRVESIATRITAFDQTGHGYQSQAGPLLGPGNERATILEPQLEILAAQGARVEHRIVVPIDVVTSASADALDKHRRPPDAISSASRQNFAGTFDWTATYRANSTTDVAVRSGLHLEEPFRSWHAGLSTSQSLGEGDWLISASALEVFDWFDHFDIRGFRGGRTDRSSTTGTVGATKLLTPTTLANVNYGLTVQTGELGNTWNVVPLARVALGAEILPKERIRHALVARLSQFLPWNGALHAYYRFYDDDWGIVAQSIEGELLQRLLPIAYVGFIYRFHRQTGASFFTTLATPADALRTADSDLAPLDAQTFGGKLVFDVPIDTDIKMLHVDIGFERYVRTNDLQMTVVTCGTGYRF
jgi:hypothetical protein